MGIINVTPDSFFDGGRYLDVEAAIEHGLRLVEEGARYLDIGGESTRPGARPVDVSEELARVLPVIRALKERTEITISVDTRKAVVARAALEAGAGIVNDISALRHDSDMAAVVRDAGCPVVLMHMQGSPETMQVHPHYLDVREEVRAFFQERLDFCATQGISHPILDPGIGFGKRLEDNLDLLSDVASLKTFGHEVLVGASNKSFIGILSDADPDERVGGTIAAHLQAWLNGADILRVHEVQRHRQAMLIWRAIANHGGEVAHAV